jgi:hypothetical protein
MKSQKTIFFYVALLFVIFTPHAHAYLDPGTGSYVLQILAAAFLAGTVVIKGFGRNIKDIFNKILGKGKDSENRSGKNS